MSEGKVYKRVGGNKAPNGTLKFLRASELAKTGVTGVIAEGTFEGTMPNNMEPTKLDFKIRDAEGNLTVVNTAGNLSFRMAEAIDNGLIEGGGVRISYNGKKMSTKGKLKGKELHSFDVEIEVNE